MTAEQGPGGEDGSDNSTVSSDAAASEEEVADAEVLDDVEAVELDLAEAVDEVRRERDEYLDTLRRIQADFENYRKRVQRQQEDAAGREAERLVTLLLPALDAFDLAEAHLAGDEEVSPGGLLQAATLLREILGKGGLERVGEVGETFDPTAHEAVEHEPAAGDAEGSDAGADPVVAKVLRSGYRWRARVVRPAMVAVRG